MGLAGQSLVFRLPEDHWEGCGRAGPYPVNPKSSSVLPLALKIARISRSSRPPSWLIAHFPDASQESLLAFGQDVKVHARKSYIGSSATGGTERGEARPDPRL